MFRSAFAALILAILPGLVMAQEPRTHTVAEGETLWGIAVRYYNDGFQWTRIADANRDRVSDPNRIDPGMELVIPGAGAQVTGVQVTTEPMAPSEQAPGQMAATPGSGMSVPATQPQQGPPPPTVFRREAPTGVAATFTMRELMDVPAEDFYGAPWLIPTGTVPARTGTVTAFVTAENIHGGRISAHPYEQLNVTVEGSPPAVGSRLQTIRVTRDIPEVGRVVKPTGVLVVEESTPAGVVARIEMEFDRLLVGDLVRPLPPYTPQSADAAQPVSGGQEATVLGVATDHALQSLGDHIFLDVGGDQGARIGDEYVVLWNEEEGGGTTVQGRAKIVAVLPNVSTGRIVELENPVFSPGVRLTLNRRVP